MPGKCNRLAEVGVLHGCKSSRCRSGDCFCSYDRRTDHDPTVRITQLSLRNALLGVLSVREMSGYDIKRSFDRAVHFVWNAADSQIYRELREMEKVGLISSRLIQQDGKPNKRLYQLNSAGTEALQEWLRSPAETPHEKEPFLMRLFFMGRISDDAAIQVLEQRCDEIRALLAIAAERRTTFADLDRAHQPEMLWWQVRLIDGFEQIHSAQLAWLEGIIEDVRAGAPYRQTDQN